MKKRRRILTRQNAHSVWTWYVLSGEKGAAHYLLLYVKPLGKYYPVDVGIHSTEPLYEGHESLPQCNVAGCTPCYFSPGIHAADSLRDAAPEQIWDTLGVYYERTLATS
jgi:hypothetical protein